MYALNFQIKDVNFIKQAARLPDTITVIHAPSGFGKSTMASLITEGMASTALLSIDSISTRINNAWLTDTNQITDIPIVIEGTSDNFPHVMHIIEHLHKTKNIEMCVPIPTFDTYVNAMCQKAQAFKEEGDLWKATFLERSLFTPYKFDLYVDNFLNRCSQLHGGIINLILHKFDISINNSSGWYGH